MDPHQAKSQVGKTTKLPKSRVVILLLILAVFVSVGATAYILTSGGKFNLPFQLSKKEPTITLKTENRNPFNPETQYVNPFDTTKSPFYNLKQKEEVK